MYPRSIVKLAAYGTMCTTYYENVDQLYDRVSTTNNNLTQIMYVYIYIQIYSCHPLDH